jgi:hypothetical protein
MFSLALNIISGLEEMLAMLKDAIETIELQCVMDTMMVDDTIESLERLTAELKAEKDTMSANGIHTS